MDKKRVFAHISPLNGEGNKRLVEFTSEDAPQRIQEGTQIVLSYWEDHFCHQGSFPVCSEFRWAIVEDVKVFTNAEDIDVELYFGTRNWAIIDQFGVAVKKPLIAKEGESKCSLTPSEVKENFIKGKPLEIKEEKEMGKNMFDGIMKNFKFGKINTDEIAYSMNGIAFKNGEDNYVVYNKDGSATNVATMAFQIPLFAMPVALNQIQAGDVIYHNGNSEYVVVKEIGENTITAISTSRNEIVTIIPQKSIFGFDFYTKVITPMTMMGGNANETNPFGNILPFMLMGERDNDSKTMMALMLMGQSGGQMQDMMLPLMLMGEDKSKSAMEMFNDIQMMQMMQQMMQASQGNSNVG